MIFMEQRDIARVSTLRLESKRNVEAGSHAEVPQRRGTEEELAAI